MKRINICDCEASIKNGCTRIRGENNWIVPIKKDDTCVFCNHYVFVKMVSEDWTPDKGLSFLATKRRTKVNPC